MENENGFGFFFLLCVCRVEKKFAKNKNCEFGDLIEVMACPGGCLGGSSTINGFRQASKQLAEYVSKSPEIKDVLKNN